MLQNTGWTEDDLSALARSMVKFPGGLPGRWDRIALEVGRTVSEVMKQTIIAYIFGIGSQHKNRLHLV